ncbi:MAG TPA: helix-hairpin-helix domain-containing protein [Anaerolineales bacterium]|jgi:hypothetical protein|nr:helix-hairpin-helix domain-containing protein [Anaerolineales bacterium]
MTSFPKFLNAAELEELQELPGIGAALAKKIVAARPFSTDDDILAVKGLDEKLLVKLQAAYFERFQVAPEFSESPSGQALTPIVESEPPIVDRRERASGPRFWSRLGRAFINLVRAFLWLVLISAVLAGIGAAVYFGVPYLYEKFVRPVEANALQISEIATQQAADLATTGAEVTALQARIGSLEGRLDSAERSIADHAAMLAQLEQMQTTLEASLRAQHSELLAELDYRVKLTRAIELLSRSRLYLSQSNFGLARQDVLSARELLTDLQDVAPDDEVGALRAVIARLDLTLGNLPGYPVIAANDLEIAWQVLIDGLPASAEALATPLRVFPTVVATATAIAPPTPTPADAATPTASP